MTSGAGCKITDIYIIIIIIPILKLLEDQKKGNIKFYEKQMFSDTLLCYVCVSTR